MDTKALIKEAKARFNHNAAKQILKEKYKNKLAFAAQGGLWVASTQLLSFLSTTHSTSFVILDEYENPIKIDRIQLLEKATTVYNEVMEAWHAEWNELESKR